MKLDDRADLPVAGAADEAERRYDMLLRNSGDGIVVHDGSRILFVNDRGAHMAGLDSGASAIGLRIAEFTGGADAALISSVHERLDADPLGEQRTTLQMPTGDGRSRPVDAYFARVSWHGVQATQVVFRELESVVGTESIAPDPASLGDAIITADARLRIVGWNAAAAAMYGWTFSEVSGRRISDVLGSPDPRRALGEVLGSLAASNAQLLRVEHRHRDGHTVPVVSSMILQRNADGTHSGVLMINRRVGDTTANLEQDPLTGLAGRTTLLTRLADAPANTSSIVLMFDVDHFNQLNSRFGVAGGDLVLIDIANRLIASVRDDDLVLRIAGDRFAVCSTVHGEAQAAAIAERIRALLSEPIEIAGELLSLATSIGAAWGSHVQGPTLLLERAERAMREAKTLGGHRLCLDRGAASADDWDDDASFTRDLRDGLATGAIFVAYQPIVDLDSGRMMKMEALARWDHPRRGVVSPGEFIPCAERSGVIDELGSWVLTTACADAVALHGLGIDVDLSVNVSVLQLRDPELASHVAEALKNSGLLAARLWIEVTESVLVDDQILRPLHLLHDLGVRLVIDDFGTGYASFQYLTRLPIDAIKVDTSFVAGLGIDPNDSAIVRSVINLGRELGLQVVAEGVETEAQRTLLLSLKCRFGQGFLFDRALRFEQVVERYTSNESTPAVGSTSRSHGVDEAARLDALDACRILDTDPEVVFDSLVQLATQLMTTPMALISLIDADRQWFKAKIGVDAVETPRSMALCNEAIENPHVPLLIPDVASDARFENNPLVTGPPFIRAYAGVPLRSREGLALGTLCVLDTAPHCFTDAEVGALTALAEQAESLLDMRRRAAELHALVRRLQALDSSRPEVGFPEKDQSDQIASEVLSHLAQAIGSGPPSGLSDHVLRFGTLELDLSGRVATFDQIDIGLSSDEFDVLAFLAARAGQSFGRTELTSCLWPDASGVRPTRVARLIGRVRTKLAKTEDGRQLIETVRGRGYRFNPPDSPESAVGSRNPNSSRGSATWLHVDGVIVEVDQAAVSLFEVDDPSGLIGHDLFDFVAPDSQAATRARLEMRAAGQTPGPQVITMQSQRRRPIVVVIESRPERFDGSPAIRTTFSEVLDPPQTLRELVSGVLDDMPDAIAVCDVDFHILCWNLAAQRMYGWAEREVIGHTVDSVIRSSDSSDAQRTCDQVRSTGHWQGRTSQITRDGFSVCVDRSVTAIRDSQNRVNGVVIIYRLAPPPQSLVDHRSG